MAPRKKRKSLRKSPSVKCTSPVIRKQNKRKNDKKMKRVEDSVQEVMNKSFDILSDGEGSAPGKSDKTKSVRDVEVVGDKNILNADFIPFSPGPSENCTRNVGDEVKTSSAADIDEAPVTIIVDDNDTESICVDDSASNSDIEIGSVDGSVTNCDIEIGSVNDSVQIVEEAGKYHPCGKHTDKNHQSSTVSAKIKTPISVAKKRKIDDSIEILETIDTLPNRPKKKARKDRSFEDLSVSMCVISNSDDESPESHDPDDDIVIVETIDNNSRDSIKVVDDFSRDSVKVVDDFIPFTMSPALVREKARRKKTFQKRRRTWNIARGEVRDSGVSQTSVFQDTVGVTPASTCYKSPLPHVENQDSDTNVAYHNVYGNNMYNPNSVEKTGLRPVVIDGSNVAFGHGGKTFSSRGIEICVNYFVKRGHRVVAFVPLFRRNEVSDADRKILDDLKVNNQLAFTPSRYLHGRRVTSYDDRFIVQCAAELGGIVVSTDNYRDLVGENEAWRETIEKRLLMFTWVGDILMFPDDPNGRGGPRLEEFLRFPK